MSPDLYRFQLSFRGQLVENSVDAFDVANTILATSNSLAEIANAKLDRQTADALKLNISAFREGSLVTDFIYHFAPNLVVTIPAIIQAAPDIVTVSTTIIDGLKTFIEVKKFLKGKQPESVRATDGGQNVIITMGSNSSLTINYSDYRLVQSQTLAKNVSKITEPLRKDGSLLEEIDLEAGKEHSFSIHKDEAPFFEPTENLQTVSQVKYRGVISKINSKVRSGYITVGTRRIPFMYPENLPESQYIILAESLKRRLQITLTGEVQMDFEFNPRLLNITSVESELQLF